MWTKYEEATGIIICTYSNKETFDFNLRSGEAGIEGDWSDARYMVKEGKVVPRPALMDDEYEIAADGEEEISCEMPVDTKVIYQEPGGPRHHVRLDDGVFEFATAVPGIYTLEVRPSWPYIEQSVRIVAK